jgi:two-component system, cell cycle sensor histidine kinase and response regulator CckA
MDHRLKTMSDAAHDTYETLVNSINGIVWEADARTWCFTLVSHQAEAMLGYPVQQWLNDPAFWVDHIHPQDRIWAPAYCLLQTSRKGSHQFEYRMIAADGRTVWLQDVVSVA